MSDQLDPFFCPEQCWWQFSLPSPTSRLLSLRGRSTMPRIPRETPTLLLRRSITHRMSSIRRLVTWRWKSKRQSSWMSQTKELSAMKETERSISNIKKGLLLISTSSTGPTATPEWSDRPSSLCPTGSLTILSSTQGSSSPPPLSRPLLQLLLKQTPRSSGCPTPSSSTDARPASSPSRPPPGVHGLLSVAFTLQFSFRASQSSYKIEKRNLSVCAMKPPKLVIGCIICAFCARP